MKKELLNSLRIEAPCTESWDEMTGNDEVRFCSHCAKNVHNISAMTRRKAERLVAGSNGNLCIRYAQNLRGETITASPKLVQIRRQATLAAGVLAASLTLSTLNYAQGAPVKIKEDSTQQQNVKKRRGNQNQFFSIVSGIVKDETGSVISNARIILQDTKTRKIRETQSDKNGFYEFKDVAPAVYLINAEAENFQKSTLKEFEIVKNLNLEKGITLTGIQNSITSGYVVMLPKGRGFTELLKIKPTEPEKKPKPKKP